MKLAVTGVPGWLGSRLLEVVERGYGDDRAPAVPEVEALTILVQPGREVPDVMPEGTRVVVGDVRDPAAMAEAVRGADVVFHLAAIIHPGVRGLDELMSVNAGGTENVVQAAARAGVRRVVYVSSNSAAGLSTRLARPFRESDPDAPYLAYGRSKVLAERAVLDASREGRVEGVALRACWYHGPHQADRQTRFFRMIAGGRPILFGSGRNLRSLTYVDHLVAGLFAAAQTPDADGKIYWIVDERPYTTMEIYEAIAEALGVAPPKPKRVPALVGTACRLADHVLQRAGFYWSEVHVAGELAQDIAALPRRAEEELGYRPWVDLREGMARSVRWCREQGQDLGGIGTFSKG